MKTSLKNSPYLISIIVFSFILISLIGGVILHTIFEERSKVSEAQTLKNISLYREAARKGDPSLCDQIVSGIGKVDRDNSSKSPEYRFYYGRSTQFKEMNEQEARDACRDNAQRALERTQRFKER